MFLSKNKNLKKYTLGLWQYISTSQFIYMNPEKIIKLKRLSFRIETRKQKKIHFVYLWLLTKKIPYLKKFYPAWKNNSRNNLIKTKQKKYSLQVKISTKNKFNLLYNILMEIISKQIHSEKKIWTFQADQVRVSLFSVPLTKNTVLLQIKNTYFPNIPMTLQFKFSKTTAFQKLFFLRSLKILSTFSKIAAFDSF